MVDLIGPAIGAGAVFIAGGLGWLLSATRTTEGTAKGVSSLGRSLDNVREEHSKRLDCHDEEIHALQTDYISRREFDEKMVATMAAINASYSSIKDQLQTHGRWLEYAVFNKKADEPRLFSSDSERT